MIERPKRPFTFLAVCLLPLLLLLQNPSWSEPIHNASLTVLKPVLLIGHAAAGFLAGSRDGLVRFWKTFHHQGDYEARIAELEGRVHQLQEAEKENLRLKKLLDFRDALSSGKRVAARVIGWDPAPWRKTIILDKGSNQGVLKDMAVVVPEGLVGRIYEVGLTTSRAILLIDQDSRVSAIADQSRAQGVIAGEGSSPLQMTYLELESGLKVEETVMTSGSSGIFPKDLRIGKITSLSKDSSGLHLQAKVEPFVQFSRLEEVLCLASSPQK